MDETSERELALLKRLEAMASRAPEFSEDEVRMIREAIRAYEGLRAFGRGARFVVVALGLVAAFIASWEAITNKVREWLGVS